MKLLSWIVYTIEPRFLFEYFDGSLGTFCPSFLKSKYWSKINIFKIKWKIILGSINLRPNSNSNSKDENLNWKFIIISVWLDESQSLTKKSWKSNFFVNQESFSWESRLWYSGLSGMLERGTTPTSADKKLRNNILNFLVMLGTSAFLARHEVSNSFPMYLVPCWERARTYQSNESLNNVLSSCLSLTSAFIETIILALSQFLW